MKIYFCDICNESIPLTDLKDGQASTIKGKIFCSKCNPLNSLPDRKRKGALGSLLLLVLFLLATGAGAGGLYYAHSVSKRLDEQPSYAGPIAALDGMISQVLGRLDEMRDSQKKTGDAVAAVNEERAAMRQSLTDVGQRLDRTESGSREVRTLLDSLRSDREMIQRLEIEQGKLEKSMAEVREALATLNGRLSGMVTMGPPESAEVETPVEEPEAVVEFDEETRRLIANLESKDPSVRWSSVDRLAALRDPNLIPYLVPLLEDPDTFVQFRVITTLRELNARTSVGKLVALLRDGDPMVREEALEALVYLTGNNNRFDVNDTSSAEWERSVRSWENWYRENQDRFKSS